jgi:DNA-binding transcriptional LysR family regulator
MEIEDIQAFSVVAETGSLTSAAHRLGVSKSIVSRRLARLERDLGAVLLTRTTRGTALTEAGANFRDHAARITADVQSARDMLSDDGPVRGRLRVSAPMSFGATHFAPVLAELADRHRELEVHASYDDQRVDLVSEGFDAAIRLGHLQDSSLVARRIASFGGRVVASPQYLATHPAPRTPEDLRAHAAVCRPAEEWPFEHQGRVIHFHPQGRFTADHGASLVPAALAGLGVAVLPDFLIHAHIASGALVALLPDYPVPEAGMYVVRPPGGNAPRKVRALIEIMMEKFGGTSCPVPAGPPGAA